ncbi:MAG: nucleotide pyrophosphohydrolase, partial [Clostridiales bacterium]|nr:nucleotide pyrophosphohydrolase [Clostridiales bacterium]
DILWYCALAASALGRDLGDIAQENVDKLRRRYPAGFEAERSLHREE